MWTAEHFMFFTFSIKCTSNHEKTQRVILTEIYPTNDNPADWYSDNTEKKLRI